MSAKIRYRSRYSTKHGAINDLTLERNKFGLRSNLPSRAFKPDIRVGHYVLGNQFWQYKRIFNLIRVRWNTLSIDRPMNRGVHEPVNAFSYFDDNVSDEATARAIKQQLLSGVTLNAALPTLAPGGEETSVLILSIPYVNSTDFNKSNNEIADVYQLTTATTAQFFDPIFSDNTVGQGKENIIPLANSAVLNPNTGQITLQLQLKSLSGEPYPFQPTSRTMVQAVMSVYLK